MSDTFVNLGLYLSYILIVVGTLAAVVFPILYLIKDPKSAKATFIGLAAVFGVLLISYLFADGTVLPSYANYGTTEASSKFVSTGLIAFYILAFISMAAVIYSEISKAIK